MAWLRHVPATATFATAAIRLSKDAVTHPGGALAMLKMIALVAGRPASVSPATKTD